MQLLLLLGLSHSVSGHFMHVDFHKNFKKSYSKLPSKLQTQFDVRLALYLEDRTSPILNIHKLHGKEAGFYSLNVTSDYRAVYKLTEDTIIFYKIGTHSELY